MTIILPPTSRLPSIASIASQPAEVLVDAIRYLRMVYSAEVRGAHRRIGTRAASASSTRDRDNTLAPKDVPPSPSTVTESVSVIPPEMDLEELRSDAFERSYAIRWLTVLLPHAEGNINITSLEQSQSQSSLSQAAQDSDVDSDAILEDAASLLAICSGAAAAGTFTRTFSFQLPQGVQSMGDGSETDTDIIKVQLKDIPLDNHDFSSVGAQTWGGACVLAELIVERPREFGVDDFGVDIDIGSDSNIGSNIGSNIDSNTNTTIDIGSGSGDSGGKARKLRILELGAGTGLVSITLGKLYQKLSQARAQARARVWRGEDMGFDVDIEIVATDFYSSVLRNLQGNIDLNLPSSGRVSLTAHPLDWSLFPSSSLQPLFPSRSLKPDPKPPFNEPEPPFDDPEPPSSEPEPEPEPPFDEPFDIVLGSDIIYEPMHAGWIRACLGGLLRRPQCLQSPGQALSGSHPQSQATGSHMQSPGQASQPRPQSPGLASTGFHPQSQASQPTFSPGQASTGLQPTPTFHLVIPLRPTHLQEAKTVEEVFPRRADVLRRRGAVTEVGHEHEREHEWEHEHELEHEHEHEHEHAHEHMELAIYSMETIACDTGSGFSRSRARGEEEVEYVYYKIGWC